MNGMESMVDMFHFNEGEMGFEDCAHENGFRHWYARDLMEWLGYKSWSSFRNSINKAISVCTTLGIEVEDNFKRKKRLKDEEEVDDYCLSKFACYLTIMNSDGKMPNVAKAQAYFFVITEAFRKYVQEQEDIDRLNVRKEISDHEKSLSGLVHEKNVENFALFRNSGYVGMYNMNYNDLKDFKGIPSHRTALDFMNKVELAANLFRITQTEEKIRNENIQGQSRLENAALDVGKKVRDTMIEISGTYPEDIPAAQDIRNVQKDIKNTHRNLKKLDSPKKKR